MIRDTILYGKHLYDFNNSKTKLILSVKHAFGYTAVLPTVKHTAVLLNGNLTVNT